jgi:DNA invertase Pin-like site-specific DNA recombinase
MTNDSSDNKSLTTVPCAIYTRSATSDTRSDTHANQERICRAAVKQLAGWTVLDHHIYSEQASGLRAGAELNSLLDAARSSPRLFKYVLVAEPDRLGRNLVVVANLLHKLESNGVYIYFAGLGHDSRLADYRLMLTLRMKLNEQYTARLARRGACQENQRNV